VGGLKRRGRQRALLAARRSRFYPSYGAYAISACDDPALLWFRVSKVATRTIITQLRANGLHHRERYSVRYPLKRFEDHFAFAFVRNPWDRLVSCWANRAVTRNAYGFDGPTLARMQDFAQFVDFAAARDLDTGDVHLRRQAPQIDLNRVDFVGRFETLDADLRHIFGRLELPLQVSVHVNASARDADYRHYYDDRTAELVGSLYQKDVRTFGYRFDPE